MPDYYDRQGNRITMMDWAQRFEDRERKRVAFDTVGGVEVSTVWLGLNHQFGDGPPLIFETMVFGGEDDGWQDRYSTEAEAEAGHAAVLAKIRAGERLD